MLSYRINTPKDAEKLVWFCMKFNEDVNIGHRHYIIDGKSILGVMSLIGNIVTVEIITNDEDTEEFFEKEFVKLVEENNNYDARR